MEYKRHNSPFFLFVSKVLEFHFHVCSLQLLNQQNQFEKVHVSWLCISQPMVKLSTILIQLSKKLSFFFSFKKQYCPNFNIIELLWYNTSTKKKKTKLRPASPKKSVTKSHCVSPFGLRWVSHLWASVFLWSSSACLFISVWPGEERMVKDSKPLIPEITVGMRAGRPPVWSALIK